MDNLIRIKLIIDHITKEPLYPATHAIGVGYTNKNGECITVLEALDNLKNAFEILSEYYLTLGYGENQAFPGNEGKDLIDAFADLSNLYVSKELFNEELSTKLDTLVSGENIKTINEESLLIDENTPEDEKNLSLSNSDEANSNEENPSLGIKYKALAQGEEQMLVLKSMGPDFDILELPSILDPTHPYTTNLAQYDLNDDGKINYTEISMLYTFVYGNQDREEDPQEDFPNPIYDEGNGFKYTYRREEVINGNNTRYKLFLYKSENNEPWEKVEGKTVDMSAYTEEIHTPNIENAEELEDGELTSADITALYNIILYIALNNNVQLGSQDFEGENTIFAIFDPDAPRSKKIKIGYNFLEYIKYKDPKYILFECAPSKNVIYCNSFTGKLYRWSTNPNSAMLELYADSYSRNAIKNLLSLINTLSDLVDTLSNTKLDTLESGINVKTINNSSILGSGNFLLAGLNKDTKDSVTYKALKLGEEQMLVLKSMGDLDIMPLDSSLEKYDLNGDGAINYAEIQIAYSIILGESYEGFYYRAVHEDERDSSSPLVLQKKAKNEETWTTVSGKTPDTSGDGVITAGDVTLYYILIGLIAAQEGIAYDPDEFTGGTAVFSAYDSKLKKIIVGFNFSNYITASDKSLYILTTFDPSPNVIYCNSFNNKLYRWNANQEQMVEINFSTSATLSAISSLLHRVEQVESQMEEYGGTVSEEEPATPVDPSRQ